MGAVNVYGAPVSKKSFSKFAKGTGVVVGSNAIISGLKFRPKTVLVWVTSYSTDLSKILTVYEESFKADKVIYTNGSGEIYENASFAVNLGNFNMPVMTTGNFKFKAYGW